jgi:hypothetical protein
MLPSALKRCDLHPCEGKAAAIGAAMVPAQQQEEWRND